MCSTSGRIDLPLQPKCESTSTAAAAAGTTLWASLKAVEESLPSAPYSLKTCQTLRVSQKDVEKSLPSTPINTCALRVVKEAVEKRLSSAREETPMQKEEMRYRDLIEKWIPPSLNDDLDSLDQDWLFNRKRDTCAKKKQQPISTPNMLCSASALWPPRAQFLPDAEIYALPYTIPY
ncbi:unnamed protein product [Cuscuta campestris]|uniref:Uncharacterized protein n=1 Tax=Cuscuta campestris TaxID=132261 RepID=A0A484NUM0_9ASTE|nr:unnamed protein product [Cuscuta campestris]